MIKDIFRLHNKDRIENLNVLSSMGYVVGILPISIYSRSKINDNTQIKINLDIFYQDYSSLKDIIYNMSPLCYDDIAHWMILPITDLYSNKKVYADNYSYITCVIEPPTDETLYPHIYKDLIPTEKPSFSMNTRQVISSAFIPVMPRISLDLMIIFIHDIKCGKFLPIKIVEGNHKNPLDTGIYPAVAMIV